MARAGIHNSDIEACGLTYSELQELWLGPCNGGSVFASTEELRAAWATGRAVVMRLWAARGRRPMAWWCFDAPDLNLKYPVTTASNPTCSRLACFPRWNAPSCYALGDANSSGLKHRASTCTTACRSCTVPVLVLRTTLGPEFRVRWSSNGARRRAGTENAQNRFCRALTHLWKFDK
jgi:hypothetical protein